LSSASLYLVLTAVARYLFVQFIPGMTSFSFGSWRPVVQSASSPAVKETAGVPASVTPDTIYKTYGVSAPPTQCSVRTP
jgi:hypothetical protein